MVKKLLALGLLALAWFAQAPARAADAVKVLYAGSLAHLMEQRIGPAFQQATGLAFQGYAGGSNALANQIKGRLRQADVFISASPKVNQSLMGEANGDWVRWYLSFAQSPLLIGYNPRSRYAADLKTRRWDQALAAPGIRIGRTDPRLDPKGAFTVQLLEQAQRVYGDPSLSRRVLGDAQNPAQIFPEEVLVGRLQSGQLDAGFFYSTETTELGIPALPLPAPFDIKASYTITILERAPNPGAARRLVEFLLGEQGGKLLRDAGIEVIEPSIGGDAAAVPADLRACSKSPSSPRCSAVGARWWGDARGRLAAWPSGAPSPGAHRGTTRRAGSGCPPAGVIIQSWTDVHSITLPWPANTQSRRGPLGDFEQALKQ